MTRHTLEGLFYHGRQLEGPDFHHGVFNPATPTKDSPHD